MIPVTRGYGADPQTAPQVPVRASLPGEEDKAEVGPAVGPTSEPLVPTSPTSTASRRARIVLFTMVVLCDLLLLYFLHRR